MTEAKVPRPGDRYRARLDTTVDVSTILAAPSSGVVKATLPMGEIVKIETVIVNRYSHYALTIELGQLLSDFELLPPAV